MSEEGERTHSNERKREGGGLRERRGESRLEKAWPPRTSFLFKTAEDKQKTTLVADIIFSGGDRQGEPQRVVLPGLKPFHIRILVP